MEKHCKDCFYYWACSSNDTEGHVGVEPWDGCDDYVCVPTPEELAKRMKEASENVWTEDRHIEMDGIMLNFLRQLGYGEAVDIFNRTEKWYA